MSHEPDCTDAVDYYNSIWIKVIEVAHIVACTLSLVFTALFYIKCRKHFYFHKNCMALIRLVLATNILHGISITGTQVYHLIRRYTVSTPCDILNDNNICYYLRFPAHIAMCIYVYVQVALAVERIVAVCFLKNYERHRSSIGYILVTLVITFSVSASYVSLLNWKLDSTSPYCSNVNQYTYEDTYVFICYVNSAITLLAFVAFMAARIYNLRMYRKRCFNGTKQRYQVNENETVFNILLPEITFHFVFSIFYAVTNALANEVRGMVENKNEFRVYLAGINTIPYYSFLSPIFMWLMLCCQRRKRHSVVQEMTAQSKNPDLMGIYFTGLNNQWK